MWDWVRLPDVCKGKEFIIPDKSRTYHFILSVADVGLGHVDEVTRCA